MAMFITVPFCLKEKMPYTGIFKKFKKIIEEKMFKFLVNFNYSLKIKRQLIKKQELGFIICGASFFHKC